MQLKKFSQNFEDIFMKFSGDFTREFPSIFRRIRTSSVSALGQRSALHMCRTYTMSALGTSCMCVCVCVCARARTLVRVCVYTFRNISLLTHFLRQRFFLLFPGDLPKFQKKTRGKQPFPPLFWGF